MESDPQVAAGPVVAPKPARPVIQPRPIPPPSTFETVCITIGMAFVALLVAGVTVFVMSILAIWFGEPSPQNSVALFGEPNSVLVELIIPFAVIALISSITWRSLNVFPQGKRIGPAVSAILLGLIVIAAPFLLAG